MENEKKIYGMSPPVIKNVKWEKMVSIILCEFHLNKSLKSIYIMYACYRKIGK